MMQNKTTTTERLLAKLLREEVAATRFDSIADLTAALKARCQRLRIRATDDDISAAYRIVGSNLRLVAPPAPAPTVAAPPPVEDIPAKDARAIWRMLLQRLHAPSPIRTMPPIWTTPDEDAARLQLLRTQARQIGSQLSEG